ncbi:MAG: glycosyltransferase family 2 protein [Nitrospira sp.]|nr:glycosyltransferase family 2 protein [Nitrospira sp.]
MSLAQQYKIWLARYSVETGLPAVKCENLVRAPLISIVVSVAGLPLHLLSDTLTSIVQQGYAKWELVLACESSQATAIRCLPEVICLSEQHALRILEVEAHGFRALILGLTASSGEFVWFLKCGDLLAPDALTSVVHALDQEKTTDLLYCDEDQIPCGGIDPIPFFKPSWSPELLLSMNYLSYSTVFRRTLLSDVIEASERGLDPCLYDSLLWASEHADGIVHLARILYHSRAGLTSQVGDETRPVSGASPERAALERALERRGIAGKVEETVPGHFHIRYRLEEPSLVSIIIPTRDRVPMLSKCLASIVARTTYAAYEILILDNESATEDAKKYFDEIVKKWRVLSYPGPFNFSAINNYAAGEAKGRYLLFLNDDTEVISPDWLTIMVEQASRPNIGAVGAKLLFPSGRIQHGGVVLGVGGVAGHAFRHMPNHEWGYHGLAHMTRNCSAVTGACMLVPRALFFKIQGFDPALPVEYNDVDLCLRIAREGYRIVYAPDAVLHHYESATRRGTRCRTDEARAQQLWGELIRQGDRYYNVNLTRDQEDWSLKL